MSPAFVLVFARRGPLRTCYGSKHLSDSIHTTLSKLLHSPTATSSHPWKASSSSKCPISALQNSSWNTPRFGSCGYCRPLLTARLDAVWICNDLSNTSDRANNLNSPSTQALRIRRGRCRSCRIGYRLTQTRCPGLCERSRTGDDAHSVFTEMDVAGGLAESESSRGRDKFCDNNVRVSLCSDSDRSLLSPSSERNSSLSAFR